MHFKFAPNTQVLATGYSQFVITAIIEDVKTHSVQHYCYWEYQKTNRYFFDGKKRCRSFSHSDKTLSWTCRYSAEENRFISNLTLKNLLERGTTTIGFECYLEDVYKKTINITVKGKIIFS